MDWARALGGSMVSTFVWVGAAWPHAQEALTALCDSVLPTPSQPTPSKPTPSQPGSRFPGGFGSTATAAAATRPEGVRGASGNVRQTRRSDCMP